MPGDREIVGVMPSERGTIQRGLASETQGQGTWPEATAPSSRRLPTAAASASQPSPHSPCY